MFSALDAYVLLEVYDTIRVKNAELDLELHMEPTGNHTMPHRSKMQKHQQRVAEKSNDNKSQEISMVNVSHLLQL